VEFHVADPEKDEVDRLARSFMTAREMEHMRSYLERGRPHRGLSLEELAQRWAAAGNAFIGDDDQSQVRSFQDLDAEYKLRKEEPPYPLLHNALEKAQARVAQYTEEDFEHVRRHLESFVDDLEKPKN
jgi:hypothetical protein